MMPTINEYLHALATPTFRTLGRMRVDGEVMLAGRNAVIFRLFTERGEAKSLKCFLASPAASEAIYGYLARSKSPLLPARTHYLPRELWIFERQEWANVVISDWIPGTTLENRIAGADPAMMEQLAAKFDDLARTLLAEEWAHGDLKPENIVVDDALTMTPIDHDAMFLPALAGRAAHELGTPLWQHPARDASLYDKHLDDYSIALISTTLHVLARWPQLRQAGDPLLLDPAEVVGGTSALYPRLLQSLELAGEGRLCALACLLASPSPRLPGLRQLMYAGSAPRDTPLEMFIERGKWGYRTAAGQVAIHPQYDRAFDFSDGLAAVRLGASWHFIDPQNQIRINGAHFTRVKPFHEGLAAVEQQGKWGYIAPDGNWAIEPRYTAARNFRDGKAQVVENDKELLISR